MEIAIYAALIVVVVFLSMRVIMRHYFPPDT